MPLFLAYPTNGDPKYHDAYELGILGPSRGPAPIIQAFVVPQLHYRCEISKPLALDYYPLIMAGDLLELCIFSEDVDEQNRHIVSEYRIGVPVDFVVDDAPEQRVVRFGLKFLAGMFDVEPREVLTTDGALLRYLRLRLRGCDDRTPGVPGHAILSPTV